MAVIPDMLPVCPLIGPLYTLGSPGLSASHDTNVYGFSDTCSIARRQRSCAYGSSLRRADWTPCLQWKEDSDCFIGRTCTGEDCESVSDVNAPGKDLNRVWCRNEYYVREWETWTGGHPKGPSPCSHISDDGALKFTVEAGGVRKHVATEA